MPTSTTGQVSGARERRESLPASVSDPDDARGERMLRLALLVSMAAGLLLRTLQFAAGRALWLDEAALSATVLRPGLGTLFRPYAYGQTAPLGFMLLEKAAVAALGAGEHALRLFPYLAGIAALALFPAVARRYVSRGAAVLGVALFAFAPFLLYYGAEAKQYSFDALAAVAVLACVAPFLDREPPVRPRDAWLLAAAGVVGVWFSQPAVFVLAGAGLALAADALRRGERGRLRLLAALGAAWAASFAASYLLSRSLMSDPQYLHDFWRAGFMPPPTSVRDALWLPRSLLHVFREPLGPYGNNQSWPTQVQMVAGLLAFCAGCAALWRARRLRLAVLVLPLALAATAAAVQAYPLGANYPTAGRVLIFILPALVLVIGEGVAWLGRLRAGVAARAAAGVLALALLAPSLGYAAIAVPHMRDEIKPLLQYAAEQRRPGDLLYVHYRALPSFRYYAGRYGWTGPAVVEGVCARLRPAGYLDQLASLRGHRRVWVLFVDGMAAENYDERVFMTSFLDHIGRKEEGVLAAGAWLYLYDLRPENTRPGRFLGRALAPPRRYDAALDCRGPWAR